MQSEKFKAIPPWDWDVNFSVFEKLVVCNRGRFELLKTFIEKKLHQGMLAYEVFKLLSFNIHSYMLEKLTNGTSKKK
jgi:hypothetical protein